jgi:hypothetical protein
LICLPRDWRSCQFPLGSLNGKVASEYHSSIHVPNNLRRRVQIARDFRNGRNKRRCREHCAQAVSPRRDTISCSKRTGYESATADQGAYCALLGGGEASVDCLVRQLSSGSEQRCLFILSADRHRGLSEQTLMMAIIATSGPR